MPLHSIGFKKYRLEVVKISANYHLISLKNLYIRPAYKTSQVRYVTLHTADYDLGEIWLYKPPKAKQH